MRKAEQPVEFLCDEAGGRLDAWLIKKIDGFSRNAAQRLIADGHVFVNGSPAAKNYKTKTGDKIVCDISIEYSGATPAQDIKLKIIYEDDHIIVIDKPRGMVTHPGNGNRDGTLANALAFHCSGGLSDIGGAFRPGIVHRLDKDTSGLVVAAKTNEAHYKLAAEFKERRVRKIYNAIVRGHMKESHGRIEIPIGRHDSDRRRMAITADGGKSAVTLFRVIARLPCAHTWLEIEIITGRTHQIRVHLAGIGYPVANDPVYGRAVKIENCPDCDHCDVKFPGAAPGVCPLKIDGQGQLLHASRLEFVHPVTGGRLCFTSELPAYFPVFH